MTIPPITVRGELPNGIIEEWGAEQFGDLERVKCWRYVEYRATVNRAVPQEVEWPTTSR